MGALLRAGGRTSISTASAGRTRVALSAFARFFVLTERCAMRKVAIGMPVWNGEKFVSEAIESILGQTYGDFELVISDNASTDATAEICRGYAKQDTRIRYFRQTKNIGAGPNHHEVFRLSAGRYFKWA